MKRIRCHPKTSTGLATSNTVRASGVHTESPNPSPKVATRNDTGASDRHDSHHRVASPAARPVPITAPSDESKKERRDAICRPHSGPPTLGAARRTREANRTCEIIPAKRKEAGRNKRCRHIGRRVLARGCDRTGHECDSDDRVLPDFSCRPASSGPVAKHSGRGPGVFIAQKSSSAGTRRERNPDKSGIQQAPLNRHLGPAAGPATSSQSARDPSRYCNPECTGDRAPHAP